MTMDNGIDDPYPLSTIMSLLNEKSVILGDEISNELVINYYKHLSLTHVTAVDFISLSGFPINKNLKRMRKIKLTRLYAIY